MLDARAAELEDRARRLEELSADNARDARRMARLASSRTVEGSLSDGMTKARDDARRATASVAAAMTDGMNNFLRFMPGPVQQFAAEVDRAFAPLHEATRNALGIPLSRPSSFKGRRTVYSDVVGDDGPGIRDGGGDNFEPIVTEDGTMDEPAPAERRVRRNN